MPISITVNLDTTEYKCKKSKPYKDDKDVNNYTGLISWQLARNIKTVSLEQLSNYILMGASFTGSVIDTPKELLQIPKGKAGYIRGISDEYFNSIQLFCVDIEPPKAKEGDTRNQVVFNINDIKRICKDNNINPFMIYPSFSYEEDTEPRFRVLFCANKAYEDWEQASKIIHYLIDLFTGDKACKNRARFYYGTNKILVNSHSYFFEECTTDFTSILNNIDIGSIQLSEIIEVTSRTHLSERTSIKSKSNSNALIANQKCNTSPINTTVNTPQIQAIKEWNAPKLIELLCIKKQPIRYFDNYFNNEPLGDTVLQAGLSRTIICMNKKMLWDAVLYIPLNEFLGLPYKTKISCILPDHLDNNPSANIFQDKKGKYFYKCFGECNRTCTILTILGVLGGEKNIVECINFLQDVFKIEIKENEYLKTQKEMLEQFADYILTDEFKIEYPAQAKYLKNTRLYHFSNFFRYTSSNLQQLNQDKHNRPILICNYDKLLNVMQATSRSQVSQNLQVMQICGYVEKTKEEDIPRRLLAELNNNREVKTLKNNTTITTKRTGVYSIPELTTVQFTKAEELIGMLLIDKNIKLTGLSRETTYRANGKQIANELYPQYTKENEQGTTLRSNHKTFKIFEIIQEQIETKGYCIEKDIIETPIYYTDNSKGYIKYSKNEIEVQIKKSISELCQAYGLKRTKAYKGIQEKYNMSIRHNTIIIINEEQ